MSDDSPRKRIAIVTGASRGIGEAISRRLANQGYRLIVVARSSDQLEAAACQFRNDGAAQVHALAADLRTSTACRTVIENAVSVHGGLDLLVNCAGTTRKGDFLSLTEEDFLDGFALKFHGAVNLTRAAWPHLRAARSGHVINIIGIGSRTPLADYTITGPVNSALLSFTKAMADRGVTDRVRVNGINPGFIETGRIGAWLSMLIEREALSEAGARERLTEAYRILRIGKPEEIAALVAFLDSIDGQYIHGAIFDIDGGATKST